MEFWRHVRRRAFHIALEQLAPETASNQIDVNPAQGGAADPASHHFLLAPAPRRAFI
jgi:hypothetical protein